MKGLRWGLLGLVAMSVVGCGSPVGLLGHATPGSLRARSVTLQAEVLRPESVPASLRDAVHAAAQKASDEASRKKGIDFFNVHANPVGLRIGSGAETAYVLSFLGTSKERTDINYEARALVAGGKVGFVSNYSGPGTLSATVDRLMPRAGVDAEGLSFELLMGLPGNGVTEAYERHLERLANHLQRRFQARPFAFDEDCIPFAVHQGEELAGFLFTHQRNRLVLGERKYADVQSVVLMSPDAELLGAYTLVGFNDKTPSPTTAPAFTWESERGLGPIGVFGDY